MVFGGQGDLGGGGGAVAGWGAEREIQTVCNHFYYRLSFNTGLALRKNGRKASVGGACKV